MRAQNLGDTPGLREFMASTRVLEINPDHPIIQDLDVSRNNGCHCNLFACMQTTNFLEESLFMVISLQAARKEGKPGTNQIVELLYETALMSSGFVVSKNLQILKCLQHLLFEDGIY